jgi:hypothetical protein
MEILLSSVMVALLGYQVSMPAIDNAKYTIIVHKEQIVVMNSQNGKMISCDKLEECQKAMKEIE